MNTVKRYKLVGRRIIDTKEGTTAKLADIIEHLNEDAETIEKLEGNLAHTLDGFRAAKGELKLYQDKYGDGEMSEEQLFRIGIPNEDGRGETGHFYVYAESKEQILEATKGQGWGCMGTDLESCWVRQVYISPFECLDRKSGVKSHKEY